MTEALHELHQRAEKAREHSDLIAATFTMSVMAVLIAAISVLGHRAHIRTLLAQTKAADAWAEYEARSIRRYTYELFLDLLSVAQVKDPASAGKMRERYSREVQRYTKEQQQRQVEASVFESQADESERKAARYDLGQVCLEAALVITSLTLITRRRLFWRLGSALALAGLLIAATGYWVR
jgi:Domain of unknown function (DUF4337)